MRRFLGFVAMVLLIAACNSSEGENKSVGDSLTMDPTTAQPITTEPDTVGTNNSDSLSINQNQ